MKSQVCKTDRQIYLKKGMNYWAPLVQEWQSSGLSQRDFCRSHNLSYWAFRNWKKKLLNASPKQTANLVSRALIANLIPTKQDAFKKNGVKRRIHLRTKSANTFTN